eukprot:TRINITY_DN74290_c0_g1_i1.p1 TRINITY_DN74290_c0_g1~~TRINITY_DN74290_c0_g1_i1.p1  ORF type:complete len:641 (+),score=98.91 TRINITY_DN74290_c0_g1_i1:89-1924(+)
MAASSGRRWFVSRLRTLASHNSLLAACVATAFALWCHTNSSRLYAAVAAGSAAEGTPLSLPDQIVARPGAVRHERGFSRATASFSVAGKGVESSTREEKRRTADLFGYGAWAGSLVASWIIVGVTAPGGRRHWLSRLRMYTAPMLVGLLCGQMVNLFNSSIIFAQALIGFELALTSAKSNQFAVVGFHNELAVLWAPIVGSVGVVGILHLAMFLGLPEVSSICGLAQLKRAALDNEMTKRPLKVWCLALVMHVAAAVSTLGCGNSLGPMAVRVEIGATLAAIVADILDLDAGAQETLLVAGMAAGFSSGANAPITGLVFGLEQLPGPEDRRPQRLVSALLGTVTATTVAVGGVSVATSFTLLTARGHSRVPDELALFMLLGVLCGVFAWLFTDRLGPGCEKLFASLESRRLLSRSWHPLLGGICAGVFAWASCPEVLFMGYSNLTHVLLSPEAFSCSRLALMLLLKLPLMAISRASRLTGGIFAPAMFVGVITGALVAKVALHSGMSLGLLPFAKGGMLSDPSVFATVGMAAALSSFCGVPGTAAVFVLELTHDHNLVMPMLVAICASVTLLTFLRGDRGDVKICSDGANGVKSHVSDDDGSGTLSGPIEA